MGSLCRMSLPARPKGEFRRLRREVDPRPRWALKWDASSVPPVNSIQVELPSENCAEPLVSKRSLGADPDASIDARQLGVLRRK